MQQVVKRKLPEEKLVEDCNVKETGLLLQHSDRIVFEFINQFKGVVSDTSTKRLH